MNLVYFVYLLSAPYKNCDQLLNAGIRKTGVHIITDRNWLLPFYCDQDYMGGGNGPGENEVKTCSNRCI